MAIYNTLACTVEWFSLPPNVCGGLQPSLVARKSLVSSCDCDAIGGDLKEVEDELNRKCMKICMHLQNSYPEYEGCWSESFGLGHRWRGPLTSALRRSLVTHETASEKEANAANSTCLAFIEWVEDNEAFHKKHPILFWMCGLIQLYRRKHTIEQVFKMEQAAELRTLLTTCVVAEEDPFRALHLLRHSLFMPLTAVGRWNHMETTLYPRHDSNSSIRS